MLSPLLGEIKQSKPFLNLREELWLNLSRTAAAVGHGLEQQLRPYGLSTTQYNVLRILRGSGAEGLCQHEIGERLVAQVPDVPRILDRMERAGWIARERGTTDRRMVIASLTGEGARLVEELDEPIVHMMNNMFQSLTDDEMMQVNVLLTAARRGRASASD
jgi:DNA-binding MarR family transcriptional regulator